MRMHVCVFVCLKLVFSGMKKNQINGDSENSGIDRNQARPFLPLFFSSSSGTGASIFNSPSFISTFLGIVRMCGQQKERCMKRAKIRVREGRQNKTV